MDTDLLNNIIKKHVVHVHVVFSLFSVEPTVVYNETETNVNITETEEFINKTTITIHHVSPPGKKQLSE